MEKTSLGEKTVASIVCSSFWSQNKGLVKVWAQKHLQRYQSVQCLQRSFLRKTHPRCSEVKTGDQSRFYLQRGFSWNHSLYFTQQTAAPELYFNFYPFNASSLLKSETVWDKWFAGVWFQELLLLKRAAFWVNQQSQRKPVIPINYTGNKKWQKAHFTIFIINILTIQ